MCSRCDVMVFMYVLCVVMLLCFMLWVGGMFL